MAAIPPRTFLAIYRGASASDGRLVAVTDAPELVARVVDGILAEAANIASDRAVAAIDRARRRALRSIRDDLAGADAR